MFARQGSHPAVGNVLETGNSPIIYNRSVAQLIEHWSPKPKVESLSLSAPANLKYSMKIREFTDYKMILYLDYN